MLLKAVVYVPASGGEVDTAALVIGVTLRTGTKNFENCLLEEI